MTFHLQPSMDQKSQDFPGFQQFNDLFFVRGSVQALKCDFQTGDVELYLYGNCNKEPLKTYIPIGELRFAIQTLSKGQDYSASTQKPEDDVKLAITKPENEQYNIGDQVVAKDKQGRWYRGTIKAELETPDHYRVTYPGFPPSCDDDVHTLSIRRVLPTMPQPKALKDFPVGTKVIYCDNRDVPHSICLVGEVNLGDNWYERTRDYSVVALL